VLGARWPSAVPTRPRAWSVPTAVRATQFTVNARETAGSEAAVGVGLGRAGNGLHAVEWTGGGTWGEGGGDWIVHCTWAGGMVMMKGGRRRLV
jgi:hypothetical protein